MAPTQADLEAVSRKQEEVAGASCELEAARREIERLRAVQMQQQLAPAAPPAAARPPYRLVQANAERFAHQQQAMRGGTVRAIIDKRQLCELVVQMQDAQGQLVEPLSLRMGVVPR